MFCRNCGNEIPEGSKFCAKCGTPAFVTAPDSQKAPAGGMAAPGPGLTPNYAQPAPAYNTGTYYNTQPKEPVKRAITKWPASIGVMGILYLVFYLASMAANYLSFEDIYLMPFGVFLEERGSFIFFLPLAFRCCSLCIPESWRF